MKKTWAIIKNVKEKRSIKNRNSSNLKVGNDILTDDKQIADNLNHLLVNIGSNISNNIPGKLSTDYGKYLENSYPHSCYLNPTTLAEVGNIINDFNNKPTTNTSIIPNS